MQANEFAGPPQSRHWFIFDKCRSKFEFELPVVQGGQDQAMPLGVGFRCDQLGFYRRDVLAPVLLGCCRHARFSI